MVHQMNGNYCSENKNVKILTGQIEQITKTNKNMYCFGARSALQSNSNHAAVDIDKR